MSKARACSWRLPLPPPVARTFNISSVDTDRKDIFFFVLRPAFKPLGITWNEMTA